MVICHLYIPSVELVVLMLHLTEIMLIKNTKEREGEQKSCYHMYSGISFFKQSDTLGQLN